MVSERSWDRAAALEAGKSSATASSRTQPPSSKRSTSARSAGIRRVAAAGARAVGASTSVKNTRLSLSRPLQGSAPSALVALKTESRMGHAMSAPAPARATLTLQETLDRTPAAAALIVAPLGLG
jgi:hypothetical protein